MMTTDRVADVGSPVRGGCHGDQTDDVPTMATANMLYDELTTAGIDALVDDRLERQASSSRMPS